MKRSRNNRNSNDMKYQAPMSERELKPANPNQTGSGVGKFIAITLGVAAVVGLGWFGYKSWKKQVSKTEAKEQEVEEKLKEVNLTTSEVSKVLQDDQLGEENLVKQVFMAVKRCPDIPVDNFCYNGVTDAWPYVVHLKQSADNKNLEIMFEFPSSAFDRRKGYSTEPRLPQYIKAFNNYAKGRLRSIIPIEARTRMEAYKVLREKVIDGVDVGDEYAEYYVPVTPSEYSSFSEPDSGRDGLTKFVETYQKSPRLIYPKGEVTDHETNDVYKVIDVNLFFVISVPINSSTQLGVDLIKGLEIVKDITSGVLVKRNERQDDEDAVRYESIIFHSWRNSMEDWDLTMMYCSCEKTGAIKTRTIFQDDFGVVDEDE